MTKSSILLKYQQNDDRGIVRFTSAIVPVDSVEVAQERESPDEAGQEVPGYALVLILLLHNTIINLRHRRVSDRSVMLSFDILTPLPSGQDGLGSYPVPGRLSKSLAR
jgi:hypothetical protein